MKDLEARSGVSRQSIHFYLREGLLPPPKRPNRNVAHYSEEHVVRLRVIKRLQEERHLPLKRIKVMMAEADFSSVALGDDLAAFEGLFLSLINGDLPVEDKNLPDVAKELQLSEADIRELARQGVVRIVDDQLDYHDVSVLRSWVAIRNAGFADVPGYGPEFAARYARLAEELAKEEVAQFVEQFADQPGDQSAQIAFAGAEHVNEMFVRMHLRALSRQLSEYVAAR